MARVSIEGLLTGLAGTPNLREEGITRASAIQGKGLGSNLARSLALQAPERQQMMRRGAGGLLGVDTRTAGEKVQEQLSSLDITTPQGQKQAVALVSQVDPARALALQTQFNEANRTASLEERRVAALESEANISKQEAVGKLNPQMYTPESLQAFADNLEKTGQKDYGLLKEIDLVKKTFEIKTSEDIVSKIGKRAEQLSSSSQRQSSLNQMSRLLDTGLKTGSLAGLSKSFKGVLSSVLDVEIEGLAEAEALEAISNKLALEVRNPASGMGLPGATSNRDLDFLIASIPGLRKSVKGNRLMIALAKEQHKMRQAIDREQARIIKENGGFAPLDLETQLSSFYTEYQIDPALRKEAEELLDPSATEKTWSDDDLEARLAELKKNRNPNPIGRR
jgi:hypothetical protein